MCVTYTMGVVEGVLGVTFGAMRWKVEFRNEICEGKLFEVDVFMEGPKTGVEID